MIDPIPLDPKRSARGDERRRELEERMRQIEKSVRDLFRERAKRENPEDRTIQKRYTATSSSSETSQGSRISTILNGRPLPEEEEDPS